MSSQHYISAKSIVDISEHEKQVYDLRNSTLITEIFKGQLGLELVKDISKVSISEDGNQFIFTLVGRADLTVPVDGDEGLDAAFKTRLFNLIMWAGQVWRCLDLQPLWYRYWIFRYLESRSLEKLNYVQRMAPSDLDADFMVTAIVPTLIAAKAHGDMKQTICAVKRLSYVQTSADDDKNQACGEILPFVIFGNNYGFNQVIPMPYYQDHLSPKEDIEPVELPQQQPLWS